MDFLDTDTSPRPGAHPKADEAVTALYAAHAVGLIRLGFVMIGDRGAAEDVVQDAFLGLYRHWDRLGDPANALTYVRSSVLNGRRAALRSQARRDRRDRAAAARDGSPPFDSAEAAVLLSEEHQEILATVRKLAVPRHCHPRPHVQGGVVTSVEDRVHAAMSAAADLAAREIRTAPSLRLPAAPAAGTRRRHGPRR